MGRTLSDNAILIDIAGIAVALEIADAGKREAVRDRYDAFVISEAEPQMVVRVIVTPGALFIPMRPGPWITEVSYEGRLLNYRSHMDRGRADFESGEADLEIAPEVDVENFLRVIYAELCLRRGAMLLHAAGVVDKGSSFVFFGHSGSGKTTASRLSGERTILSDDLVILTTHNGEVVTHGVPFRGDYPEAPRVNMSAPLGGLFSLVKAPEHALVPLSLPEAVARLAACLPFVMADAGNTKRAIEVCLRIARTVPVRALRFRLDPDFWRIIDEREISGPAPAGGDADS